MFQIVVKLRLSTLIEEHDGGDDNDDDGITEKFKFCENVS